MTIAFASRLIALAGQGRLFVIAKAGKPLVEVTPIQPAMSGPPRPLGFMRGTTLQVPEDFDRMGSDDLASLFAGGGA